MKNINIVDIENWKNLIINEAKYNIPSECIGGVCIDAGCNIGDFPINNGKRFDKYICYDVFKENINECTKNTKDLGLNIEIHKLAVWSESNKKISVMAYQPSDTKDIQHFGNSGNVGCVEVIGSHGEGWLNENTIDLVNTISIEDVIDKYGTINLLKIDVEGSEYEFLLNKDLSKINYIVGEIHFDDNQKENLIKWIENTHIKLDTFVFKNKNLI